MDEKTYSTLEAAEKADIGRATLNRWLSREVSDALGPIDASHKFKTASGNVVRRWTEADIKRLKVYRQDHHWDMPVKQNRKKK
jgi:hypothetical protein